jgi:proteic killer suppression protein
MDRSFATARLKRLCEQQAAATREFGPDSARRLRARLSDIEAADNVTELVAGHPHPLSRDRQGQFAVSLTGGHRLVFAPDHEPVPVTEDGTVDWANVRRVRIVFIGDYHD